MKQAHIFFILLFFHFISCSGDEKQNNEKNKKSFSLFKKKINTEHTDSLTVAQFISIHPEFKSEQKKIHKFYSRRNYRLAWSEHGEFLPQAGMFINILNDIQSHGLKPEHYENPQLREKYKAAAKKRHREEVSLLRKNLDILLTASFFKYSKDMWRGMVDPEEKKIEWYIDRKKVRYGKTLDAILANTQSDNPFLLYEPLHYEYHKLKKLLKDYRDLQNKGGWPKINLKAEAKLQKGDTSSLMPLLRIRLYLSEDIKTLNSEFLFGVNLEKAVKNFQRRHGLKEDGIVGGATLDAMNVSVEQRIMQIIVNMERWRWVPQKISDDYVIVNIPEFKLHAFEKEKEVWSMNVIVGEAATYTPIFNDEIEYIVMSPSWNIPSSIVTNEIIPWQRKDSTFLIKNKMEVFKDSIPIDPLTINWDTLSEEEISKLRFRQLPGSHNSLGHVKFMFPNEYDVYLHDTPTGHLFSQDTRDFSHGCIRLQDPVKFAEYLLKDDPLWTKEKIIKEIYSGQEQTVKLKKKIPVYIVYFTAWVDEQGLPNFRQDIYRHDERLAKVFFEE